MDPFRDDEEAARLRAAALRAEGERLPEVEQAAPSPKRPAGAGCGKLALGAFVVVLLFAWRVSTSCHRVTPAEIATRTAVVTRTATVSASEGKLPFSATPCDLAIAGTAQLFPNCKITLRCDGHVVFRNPDNMEVCRLDGGVPTGLFENGNFTFDLLRGTARLHGTTASGPYSASFRLESGVE